MAKTNKQLAKRINNTYNVFFNRVPVNFMDISKIYKAIETLLSNPHVDIDSTEFIIAMQDLVTLYRVKV
jgi:hypothetical protein